jgi:hypothetical protein
MMSSPRSTDLSVQQLHTFRRVLESGGYSAAARQSRLSVPTVWQHIQILEKEDLRRSTVREDGAMDRADVRID